MEVTGNATGIRVYDFDGTIYSGDSTIDFYFFCLFRHPAIIRALPKQFRGALSYYQKKCSKTAYKEAFFSFLPYLKKPEKDVVCFWRRHQKKLASWYLAQKQETDVIISASPTFLLSEICTYLGLSDRLIASNVDLHTGIFAGENCRDEEKVRRYREKFPSVHIAEFYSDSRSDCPMAELADSAFLVKINSFTKKEKIHPWKTDAET